jgi:Zn finger protein HypA/HybF involved in hydrogenase expression
MHELPATKSTCDIVVRHVVVNGATKVVSVQLEIGTLSDLQNAVRIDLWVRHAPV